MCPSTYSILYILLRSQENLGFVHRHMTKIRPIRSVLRADTSCQCCRPTLLHVSAAGRHFFRSVRQPDTSPGQCGSPTLLQVSAGGRQHFSRSVRQANISPGQCGRQTLLHISAAGRHFSRSVRQAETSSGVQFLSKNRKHALTSVVQFCSSIRN